MSDNDSMKYYYYDKEGIYRILHIHLTHRPHIGEYIVYNNKRFIIKNITHVLSKNSKLDVELIELD